MATINKIPKCPPLRFPDFNDEWTLIRLGEILSFETGYPFSSDQFNEDGEGVRLIKNRDLKADDRIVFYKGDYDDQYLVQNGNILIGMDGDFTPCLWKKGKALLNQRVGRININGDTSRVFIFYLLADFLKEIEIKTSSTTVKHLSHREVEQIKAYLPLLAEQKKIADFLSLIDERIQSCSETIAQRKSFRNGIIKLIVGNLKADRISLKECVICNTSSLSESKLDVIGIPVYGASGIVGYTSVVEADQCAILIIKDGSGVGRLKYIDSPHSFTGTLNSLKSKNSNVNLRYVYYCMSTLDLKKYSTGTGIPHIYFKDYGLESIPLPSLEEQKRIADFLSLIDERIEVEEQLLQQYEKQKRYLLKQMFV